MMGMACSAQAELVEVVSQNYTFDSVLVSTIQDTLTNVARP